MFWECPHPPFVHPPFVHIRESLEFRDLLLMDRSSWPGCLLRHGWLPALACSGGASPWAASYDDVADARLKRLLGPYSESVCRESDVSDQPDVWTDGSFILEELSGVGVGGCGVYSLKSGACWFGRWWGHLELLPPSNLGVERCVLFDTIRGPLQSVQRAELWGVILASQCSFPFHLCFDNLNVVLHVSPILNVLVACRPFELTVGGDLLTVIEKMILQ